MLPYVAGTWWIGDDEVWDEPLESQISSGEWETIGYNTGKYDHTIFVRFRLLPITAVSSTTALTPLLIAAPATTLVPVGATQSIPAAEPAPAY